MKIFIYVIFFEYNLSNLNKVYFSQVMVIALHDTLDTCYCHLMHSFSIGHLEAAMNIPAAGAPLQLLNAVLVYNYSIKVPNSIKTSARRKLLETAGCTPTMIASTVRFPPSGEECDGSACVYNEVFHMNNQSNSVIQATKTWNKICSFLIKKFLPIHSTVRVKCAE